MDHASWQLERTWPLWSVAPVALLWVVYYWRRSLVHFARWQRAASVAARVLLVLLLVVVLCGIKVSGLTKQLFVVFAVDRSQSISPEAARAAEDFVNDAVKHAGENQWSVVRFAGEVGEDTDRGQTNLAAAMAAAGAGIPAAYVPRIVLLSDGNQTTGEAVAAANAGQVPIFTMPLPGLPEHEVYVSAVHTPGQVRQGEPFDVEVVVQSTHDDEGSLQLRGGSQQAVNEPTRVHEGEGRFSFRRSVRGETAEKFTARIEGFNDTFSGNNQLAAVVCAPVAPVVPAPTKIRVLLVESQSESSRALADVLNGEGIDVTVRSSQDVPRRPHELQAHDLLILCNVPAALLSAEQLDAVQQYVRDLGGGLIVVGGDQAFTAGEYQGTKLEEMLPVSCQVKKDRPKPRLAMVLVIDRSDSMRKGGAIELAKEATWLAVEKLGPGDQVGVLAFEDTSRWISEIRPCSDEEKEVLRRQIATITAGGGTNMHPALERAYLGLNEAFADLKHMIVLTDGVSHPGDFEALAGEIAASGITVSTVALGKEAVPELLRRIAEIGGGRFYACDDPADVPQVFTLEATSAAKLGIVERPVSPQAADFADVLADLDFTQVPRLLGYVETLPKDDGRLVMAAEDGDPLLISWQYGRGVSVAFTSDVRTRWAPLWLKWPGLGRFWAEVVRHAMRKHFVLRVERKNDRAYAILDAIDPHGNYLNGAEATLKVTDPNQESHEATFTQIAPGRYAAEFAAATPGTYYLRTTLRHRDRLMNVQHRALVVGYADELRLRPTNEQLLRSIAEATGGQYKCKRADVFADSETGVRRTTCLWPYLLAAAALLFVFDVALKRVDFGRPKSIGTSKTGGIAA